MFEILIRGWETEYYSGFFDISSFSFFLSFLLFLLFFCEREIKKIEIENLIICLTIYHLIIIISLTIYHLIEHCISTLEFILCMGEKEEIKVMRDIMRWDYERVWWLVKNNKIIIFIFFFLFLPFLLERRVGWNKSINKRFLLYHFSNDMVRIGCWW